MENNIEASPVLTCSNDAVREARCRADIAGRDELTGSDFIGLLQKQHGPEISSEEMQDAANAANAAMRRRLLLMSTTCSVGFCTVGCESSSTRDDISTTAIPIHDFDPIVHAEESDEIRSKRIAALLRPY
ncbi:Hypothetical protein, putative [Bodo saltans]|uniref:Uncharacterized protein n=1 Tax=Bodo saltans TaxID=75058 RepID=A0A0S4JJC1_BODSA|nr:Hypothetical protein, putative [Bodo saltans]|eukprot:CUG90260.1 Hypothetical protein, putative [Bodo saltans]